ncbi:MAG: lytic transglycosylase domain-containing protein, partial [Bacteroidaceae bacterium]|nr:lytic transglycosylase domain-containing protein [Bacteroidaceae bacterium]
MKRLLVYSFLVLGFSTLASAQSVATFDSIASDSLSLGVIARLDSIDLPQGLIMSEDEIINAPANKGLVPGNGETRQLSFTDQQIVERLSRIPTTIDLPFNNITREYIDTYSNRRRNSVSVMLGSSNFYMPIFEEALEKYGLPLELRYLPVIESALVPTATSRVGAGGLWQFMLTTARQYGLEVNTLVDERRDPLKSSDAAARLLRDLYNMFGDWGLALASYNCGPGNVTKAIARAGNPEVKDFWTIYNYLPRETRGYVPAFIAATYIMTYYCDHGITPMEATLPQESDTIVVSKEVKFGQIANKCSNLSVDVLRTLNPQYRRDIIPANYAVRLP